MIAPELIYDAATDDEAFAHLPGTLAKAFDARSAVIHWRSAQAPGEFVHSKHFSDAHLDLLDGGFDGHDLWADALSRPDARNRAWCCHELVPETLYESGRVYNEWVRAIGDDTYHALGAVFDGRNMIGKIGLHRPRAQRQFDECERDRLNAVIGPLQRMLAVRARMADARQNGALAAAALDATGQTVIVLRPDGRLLHANRAGETVLVEGDALALGAGRLKARTSADDRALAEALASAGREGKGSTIAVTGRSGRRYVLALDPLPIGGVRHVILLVHSVASASDTTHAARVAVFYGLSATESAVAAGIASGRSPQEIADDRGTSILTVRSQIKSVMGKMGVHRQSEIAAAVAVLAGSPPR